MPSSRNSTADGSIEEQPKGAHTSTAKSTVKTKKAQTPTVTLQHQKVCASSHKIVQAAALKGRQHKNNGQIVPREESKQQCQAKARPKLKTQHKSKTLQKTAIKTKTDLQYDKNLGSGESDADSKMENKIAAYNNDTEDMYA